MLILTRKRDESIVIGDEIVITVLDIRDEKIRLGITAPNEVSVHREEIYRLIQEQRSLDGEISDGCDGPDSDH